MQKSKNHLCAVSKQPALGQGTSIIVFTAFLSDVFAYLEQLQLSAQWGAVLDPKFWEIVEGDTGGGGGGGAGLP